MAYFGLTVPYVVETIRNANSSISAGDVEEGKRKYIVRAEGEINSEKQVKDIVLISEQDSTGRYGRVKVSDIANVEFTFKEPRAVIRFLGQSSIAINAVRETERFSKILYSPKISFDSLFSGSKFKFPEYP